MKLHLTVEANDGSARTGTIRTPRGVLSTPLFMPVGTRAAVKTLDSSDLEALGVPLILGNTYHLMLRPGSDLIRQMGGLHRFMDWHGHVLTDSGGYQVFSLEPKVDDSGATFRSTYDGTSYHLTPEGSAAVQSDLGGDIQMVLDVCPGLPCPPEVLRLAVDRTALWAARGRRAFLEQAGERADRGLDQAQFGICQGGTDLDLRVESTRRTAEIDFDGYAVGGLSVGERRDEMLPALAEALAHLPAGQPRYLMGVGDPASLVEAVGLGIDLFDCVMPTRLGRHGTVLTDGGRLQVRNAAFTADDGPLQEGCACPACARFSRAYIRHLVRVGEPTAARLITIHNLHWTLALMERARSAIRAGTYQAFKASTLAVWEHGGGAGRHNQPTG